MSNRLREQKTVFVLSAFSLLTASILMLGARFYNNNPHEVPRLNYEGRNFLPYIGCKTKNSDENHGLYLGGVAGQSALCPELTKKNPVFQKSPLAGLAEVMKPLLFTVCVIVIVILGLNQAQIFSRADGLHTLEKGILRASVKCYAVEGRYPNSLQHIEDHYGLIVDKNKYIVHYEAFATNLLPNITVLER